MLHPRLAPVMIAALVIAQAGSGEGPVDWTIWKMLWSNKALLATLRELHPNHELLSRRPQADAGCRGGA